MENFLELGLPKSLVEALTNMGITKPTPIQVKALPVALEGKDILGSAATGTGKTAAFAIPIISRIIRDPEATALILSPTRELATQICQAIKLMTAKNCEAKTALLIGGDPMFKQLNQLRSRPRIIVGTPGRVTDHLKRKSLDLSKVKILVLDETDRMLDMGFAPQIEVIAKYVPLERQTLLFSATMPGNIMKLSQRYLTNPVKIETGEVNKVADNLKHDIINVDGNTKFIKLCEQLDQRDGSIVIFVKTKHGADKLANSKGIVAGGDYHFDMVRPGSALYGIRGSSKTLPLKHVVTAKAKAIQVREIVEDGFVGYGASVPIKKGARIAVCPLGYADGYIRSLSNNSHASFNGKKVPLLGRVSMDMTIFDVSSIPEFKVGDELELIGENYTVDEIARNAGTIGYEILTNLGNRYKRVYN